MLPPLRITTSILLICLSKVVQVPLSREMDHTVESYFERPLHSFRRSFSTNSKVPLSVGKKVLIKKINISKTSELSMSPENCFYVVNQTALCRKYTYFRRIFELKLEPDI